MAKLVRRKRLKISWALSHAGSTPVRGTKFKKILDYGRLQIRPELYKAKNDIINKRTYNVGDCFTHDIYYYKILKINSDNTYKVICVNFSIDDVGISLINDMSVKALNNLFILSKNYLHINSNATKINE